MILNRIDDGTDNCSNGECELNEGCLERAKAVATGQSGSERSLGLLLAERLWDTGLEEE